MYMRLFTIHIVYKSSLQLLKLTDNAIPYSTKFVYIEGVVIILHFKRGVGVYDY